MNLTDRQASKMRLPDGHSLLAQWLTVIGGWVFLVY